MKTFCILALVLALLCPPLAQAESPHTDEATQELVANLLDQAMRVDSMERRVELVLQAAQEAQGDAELLLQCAYTLMDIDTKLAYGEELLAILQDALDSAGNDLRVYLLGLAGDLLFRLDRGDEAVALAERAAEENPDNAEVICLLATALQQAGRSDEAQAVLSEYTRNVSANMEVFLLSALLYQEECLWQEALETYRQIEEQWPEYLTGLYGQYEVYKAMGDFTHAVRTLNTLLNYGADDSLWLTRAQLRLWQMHDPERALSEAEAILRASPDNADASYLKAAALWSLNRLEEAYALAETNEVYGPLLSIALRLDSGEWTEAEALCDALIESGDGWEGYALLYKALARMNGFDDLAGAEAAFAEAFSHANVEAQGYLYLGELRRLQGNLEEAARAFAEADLYALEDPGPLYSLTMVCMEAGREQDMLDALSTLQTRYPGWYETMLATVLVESAMGNGEQALESFAALKEKFPFPAQKMTLLECTLMAEVDETDARAQAERWMAEHEAELTASDWDAYAYVLLCREEYEDAAEALATGETLLSDEPDQAARARMERISLLTTQALLCLRQDDMAGCAEALEAARELGFSVWQLQIGDDFTAFLQTDAGQSLLERAGEPAEAWDLTIPPIIPEVEA